MGTAVVSASLMADGLSQYMAQTKSSLGHGNDYRVSRQSELKQVPGGDAGVSSPLSAIKNSFLGRTRGLDFATKWWNHKYLPIRSTNIKSMEYSLRWIGNSDTFSPVSKHIQSVDFHSSSKLYSTPATILSNNFTDSSIRNSPSIAYCVLAFYPHRQFQTFDRYCSVVHCPTRETNVHITTWISIQPVR